MFTETKAFKAYCQLRDNNGVGKVSDYMELGNYFAICCLEPDYMLKQFENEYQKLYEKGHV